MPAMNPVSATELASIQSDAAAILDLDCTVKRKSRTPDGMGTYTGTLSTVATTKAGMAPPTAGQLQNYGHVIGSLAAWQVKLPVGTSVQTQDHLFISGQELVVQVDLTPRSYPALLTVLASEVKEQ